MAQSEWGLKLWLENSTGWHSRLARAAVVSTGKGIDYMWATQNLKNLEKAKGNFEKAAKLHPNLSAWAGLAMIARQEGDASGQEKAVEEMRNILTENVIKDAANVSKTVNGKAENKNPEVLAKAIAEKAKLHMNKMFEGLAKDGELPWGNEKGELSFGFGFGGGPGLFHGGLLTIGMKLFIPLFLHVKPDWLLLFYDMSMKSGALSPYQLAVLYEQLTQKRVTRSKAVVRLMQIYHYHEDKEQALHWAIVAAEENAHDIETLQMAALITQWAGEAEKARSISNQLILLKRKNE
jgi:tetratricopeptide (TPR) repeat protein